HGEGRRPAEQGRSGLPADGHGFRRERRFPGGARSRVPRPSRAERLYRARADAAPPGVQGEAEKRSLSCARDRARQDNHGPDSKLAAEANSSMKETRTLEP